MRSCRTFLCVFSAEYGYQPVLLEQGAPVEERQKDVEEFWKTGVLKPDSNVQFGEGGAGTFSDGKLNTLIKDPVGRNRKVLEIFVENGAPKDILYVNKPHIGTDILRTVIRNMREKILVWGGEIHFHTQMTEVLFTENTRRIRGIIYEDLLKKEKEKYRRRHWFWHRDTVRGRPLRCSSRKRFRWRQNPLQLVYVQNIRRS